MRQWEGRGGGQWRCELSSYAESGILENLETFLRLPRAGLRAHLHAQDLALAIPPRDCSVTREGLHIRGHGALQLARGDPLCVKPA